MTPLFRATVLAHLVLALPPAGPVCARIEFHGAVAGLVSLRSATSGVVTVNPCN